MSAKHNFELVFDWDEITKCVQPRARRVTDDQTPALTDTDTVNIIIAVPPHPPVAEAGGPYTCTAGIGCQLDGSGSFDIDPFDKIVRWEWELDAIFPFDFDEASGETPIAIFPTPGVFDIGLRVWDNGQFNDLDDDGEVDEDERLSDQHFVKVTVVENLAPVADANGPYTVDEGSAINLDASGSSDPNGDPLSYQWDYDNDGNFDDATGVSPAFTGVDDGLLPVVPGCGDSISGPNRSRRPCTGWRTRRPGGRLMPRSSRVESCPKRV